MEDQVKELMADILDIDRKTITDDTAIENTANWDSLAHLNLCLALEQEFSISLEVSEMEGMISFYDIMQVVSEKL